MEQPSGTVTFLFSDIEGSTRLLGELGVDRYAAALEDHRRLLRIAFERYAGYEVDCEGDAFFVAFQTASEAVAAATEAQQALAAHAWPMARPIRVRIGIHTGEPLLAPPKYVGMDVHCAARIMAAGHGGQTLLSQRTRDLLDERFEMGDLGVHRLKDLTGPQRLYQLGTDVFPLLKTLHRSNLPVPISSFLGREQEVREITELLAGGTRLVTLTGPGGTGKTRLALQAAAEASDAFPDGVSWVALAPLRDPDHALSEVAHALEVSEEPDRELVETLIERLEGKEPLLLLDNAEHLLPDVAGRLARLVAGSAARLLVTSRERLQIAGERVFPVATLEDHTSMQLFLERAAEVGSPLEPSDSVRELCSRLDRLPLALELAAARTVVFTPDQLLDRLGQRLDLLNAGRDADPRQQTLRAAIDWSYELLDPEEQRVFRALSVFAGGCTYEGAAAVAGADVDSLQSLLDKSLIRRKDTVLGPRYWMLESIREYGLERLDQCPDNATLLDRYMRYFVALAESAAPELTGGADQKVWVERIGQEFDDIRNVSRLAIEKGSSRALAIVGNLGFFFWNRGFLTEGRALLEAALALPVEQDDLRMKALLAAALIAGQQGDAAAEERFAAAALDLARALGDEFAGASALRELAKGAHFTGDYRRAIELNAELVLLARRIGDLDNQAIALNNLGDIALREQRWQDAIESCSASREIRMSLRNHWGSALALSNVALAELQLGNIDDARRHILEALHESLDVGSTAVALACLPVAAAVCARTGRMVDAAQLLGAAAKLRHELGISLALETPEHQLEERTAVELAAALGVDAYSQDRERGREVSLEEVAELTFRPD